MKWSYVTRWLFDKPHKTGTLLNKYEVKKCLGLGGYGMIYLCTDKAGKEYVVKQLRPSKGKRQRERERFAGEVDLLREIEHHAIPSLIEDFSIENQLYYVMEYIYGENIEDLLFFLNQKFTEYEALTWMKQLLSIINYLHQYNVFHTDIRPPNIIINQEKIYLLDFGLAYRVNEDDENTILSYRQDDYYDFGQMILFLLYSNFKGKKSKKHTWLEELTLHPATVMFLKKLLGLSEPYRNGDEIEMDLEKVLQALKKTKNT